MTRRRVAVTGLGLVSPFGGDREDFFARILAGESSIGHYVTDDIPKPLSLPAANSFAFGGSNAVLAFRAVPKH